jgi:glycosyltransferase involved in cell wall biosynthesis
MSLTTKDLLAYTGMFVKTNDLYYGSLPQNQHELRTGNIRVFFQTRNQGKGAALLRAFREARGEIVIVQDADLEYDPQDYFGLIAPSSVAWRTWCTDHDLLEGLTGFYSSDIPSPTGCSRRPPICSPI